jgi:protocatechuate 3,4-dioxygenase beta subunit
MYQQRTHRPETATPLRRRLRDRLFPTDPDRPAANPPVPRCCIDGVADGYLRPHPPAGPAYHDTGWPLRYNLVQTWMKGIILSLTGRVVDVDHRPIAGARVEFWQAEGAAAYLIGGHQVASPAGRYSLCTVVPEGYDGRAPHLHARTQAPHGPVYTTRLYFPDRTRAYGMDIARLNAADTLVDRRRTISLGRLEFHSYQGSYDFVIPAS